MSCEMPHDPLTREEMRANYRFGIKKDTLKKRLNEIRERALKHDATVGKLCERVTVTVRTRKPFSFKTIEAEVCVWPLIDTNDRTYSLAYLPQEPFTSPFVVYKSLTNDEPYHKISYGQLAGELTRGVNDLYRSIELLQEYITMLEANNVEQLFPIR